MTKLLGWAAVGAVLGFLSGAAVIVLGAAMMWIFVFGDDPWPAYSGALLVSIAIAVGSAIFGLTLRLGVRRGTRAHPGSRD